MQAQEESSPVETQRGDTVSKPKVVINLGNVVYFALVPSLPPAARHHPFHLDLGTLLDFFFCVVVYGLIRTARKWQ
jgi:hypothetical protein